MIERRAMQVALGALLTLLACGDDEPPAPRPLFEEELEERCGDLPCGWSQIEGAEGQARYVTTFHSGDHGIRLAGSDVTVRGPGNEPGDVSLAFGTLSARLSAICDPGAELVIRVGLTDVADTGTGPRLDTLEGRPSVSTEWDVPATASLTALSALADGGFGSSPFVSGSFRVTGITLSKRGTGSCTVSRIVVDDQIAVPDEGC